MTGMSKAAGTLNSEAKEKRTPAKNKFLKLSFLVKSTRKAKRVGAIMNTSAFAIWPSRRGMVVRTANIIVANFCTFSLLGKITCASFQNT